MEEERNRQQEEVEIEDRGLFGFVGAKKEQQEEEVVVTGMENVRVSEEKKEEEGLHKEGFLHKLHRSHSSSSSSVRFEIN